MDQSREQGGFPGPFAPREPEEGKCTLSYKRGAVPLGAGGMRGMSGMGAPTGPLWAWRNSSLPAYMLVLDQSRAPCSPTEPRGECSTRGLPCSGVSASFQCRTGRRVVRRDPRGREGAGKESPEATLGADRYGGSI